MLRRRPTSFATIKSGRGAVRGPGSAPSHAAFAPVEGARSLLFAYGWTIGIIDASWRSMSSATLLSI